MIIEHDVQVYWNNRHKGYDEIDETNERIPEAPKKVLFIKVLFRFIEIVTLLLVLFIVGREQQRIHFDENNSNTHSQINAQRHNAILSQMPIMETMEKTEIIMPQGMQAPLTWQHTNVIGTADHPTLDGGIINATDGLPIYHPPVFPLQSQHSSNIIQPEETEKATGIKNKAFTDDWATSPKVKAILDKAVETGQLNYVLRQIDARGLPASVALLPVIESSYQDDAVSLKGAVGSWQLMPTTAQSQGISSQERTEFIPSTNAALNLLNQLHQQFGNWELAFAAYNAGSGRVEEALQKNPNATSIAGLDLPAETKNYVSALMEINQTLVEHSNIN